MSLQAFFKNNAKDRKIKKDVVISSRFLDEAGNPLSFTIESLTPEQSAKIKEASVQMDLENREATFDSNVYQFNLAASSVVYPDLLSKDLQDSYGVTSPQKLLNEMLNDKEFDRLIEEIEKLGKTKKMKDMVQEVKNF